VIPLRPKTFAVLRYLVEHAGRLVTKDELRHAVWAGTQVSGAGQRDYIRELRQALGDTPQAPRFIETVHGRGYRFIGAVQSPKSEVRSPQSPAPSTQHPAPALVSREVQDPELASGQSLVSAPGLPLPDKPSIIVLPFVNLSNDPEQEYFSDGITEDLTASLSRIASLFVIARTSAFTYKGKPVKVQEVSKELGVRYLLEGSIRKGDNRVRISTQLIDATTGHHLWSERYDRPLKDIFTLQDEIVQQIVTTLKLQLTLLEQGFLASKTTDNLEAYDYWLRGVGHTLRATKETNAHARQMFAKALELDPQYAWAYASLGATYFLAWAFQWEQGPQPLEQAFTLAQKAVALDDFLPAAHLTLGLVYLWKRQHGQAIAEAERVIALDPNYADGYVWLADILKLAGRPEEAIQLIEKAMRLNPYYPFYYLSELGISYYLTGRHEEAIVTLKEALARTPNHLITRLYLAASYSEIGREEEARAEAAEVLRLNPAYSLEVWSRITPFKDPAVLERILVALRKAGLQ